MPCDKWRFLMYVNGRWILGKCQCDIRLPFCLTAILHYFIRLVASVCDRHTHVQSFIHYFTRSHTLSLSLTQSIALKLIVICLILGCVSRKGQIENSFQLCMCEGWDNGGEAERAFPGTGNAGDIRSGRRSASLQATRERIMMPNALAALMSV